jgi:hypothetical protein
MIKTQSIKKDSIGKPLWFSPQATIQHPLEFTIPLHFGLFGFSTAEVISYIDSLPFSQYLIEAQREGNSGKFWGVAKSYHKKLNGLVFLHALTLVRMALGSEHPLEDTLSNLKTSQQVDAKLKLISMSRRPFSMMLEDIKRKGNFEIDWPYSKYFMQAMQLNAHFRFLLRTGEFFKIEYAEQFFDDQLNRPYSLIKYLPSFQEEFVRDNEKVLNELLEQGVISTTMIQNFKRNVLEENSINAQDLQQNFLDAINESIESPKYRYVVDIEKFEIKKVESNHDALSPPWFLKKDNAMGAFKEGLSEEEQQYGAIIEFRSITNVGDWFLRKSSLTQAEFKDFLKYPNEHFFKQVLSIFIFLENFGSTEDYNDIYLGVSYAAIKK